jgi:hypothetical protein
LLIFIHIEHICSFFVAFFSANIDGRNLIFHHKLHIQDEVLPTIWHTYMKLVTKYQISAIDSCWEKCDEKYLWRTEGWFLYTLNIYAHFSSHFSQQILMAEIWYFITSFIYKMIVMKIMYQLMKIMNVILYKK